jgi:hypothetical protein
MPSIPHSSALRRSSFPPLLRSPPRSTARFSPLHSASFPTPSRTTPCFIARGASSPHEGTNLTLRIHAPNPSRPSRSPRAPEQPTSRATQGHPADRSTAPSEAKRLTPPIPAPNAPHPSCAPSGSKHPRPCVEAQHLADRSTSPPASNHARCTRPASPRSPPGIDGPKIRSARSSHPRGRDSVCS